MHEVYKYLFVTGCAVIAFFASSYLLRSILLAVDPELDITKKMKLRDVGAWIGLSEFILILIFVFISEYTAIAIIFAAKEIVRSEEIKKKASYYLLGTLLNVVLALLSALVIKSLASMLFDHVG